MLTLLILKKKRILTIFSLLTRAAVFNYRHKKDEMYNLICDELLKLGGVYVKFLQGVVVQSWTMQRWQSDNKLDIFENIHSKINNAHQIIRNNLGDKYDRLSQISEKPFAIGSFGHVYKAILDNKQTVIIKILSPEIKRTLKFDLRLLKFFWYSHLRVIKFNKGLSFKHIFTDFKKQTLREIDYVAEAQAAHYQYTIYKDHPQLVIPKTYLDLCTDSVIVQDFIKGTSVANLLKFQEIDPDLNLEVYVKQNLNSNLVKQLQMLTFEILWGTFHNQQIIGDPHPGNVIIMKDNKVGLIDFGIVTFGAKHPTAYLKFIRAYTYLDDDPKNITNFFLASLQFFGRDLYLALDKLSNLIPKGQKKNNLNEELAKIMQTAFSEEYTGTNLTSLVKSPKALVIFDRIANKHNRFGFNLKVNDNEILRTLVTLTGLIDLVGIYQKVIYPAYQKAIAQVDKIYPDLKSLNEIEISYNQAVATASDWLERVANRDPGLFRDMMAQLSARTKLMRDKIELDDI